MSQTRFSAGVARSKAMKWLQFCVINPDELIALSVTKEDNMNMNGQDLHNELYSIRQVFF